MSGQFQYFVSPKQPGKPTIVLDELPEYGLAYAFDQKHQPVSVRCGTGPRPDATAGIILCSTTARIGYYPDRQKWRAMHGNPDVWVGMEDDQQYRPTPLDVARSKQADGELLTLGGDQWLIPRARQWVEYNDLITHHEVLPAPYDLDADGDIVRGETDAFYLELWRLANEFYEAERTAEPGSTFKFDMPSLASVALQANYRVGISELLLMGAIYPEHFRQVADITTDRARLDEFLKKSMASQSSDPAGDSSTSSPGGEQSTTDSEPDIVPQSPNSKRTRGESTSKTTSSTGAA